MPYERHTCFIFFFMLILKIVIRPQKPGEVNGEDYYFSTRLQMQHDIGQSTPLID
jgi:guanylate kinase